MENISIVVLGIVLIFVLIRMQRRIRKFQQKNKMLEREKGILSSIIRLSNIKGVPPKDLGDFDKED